MKNPIVRLLRGSLPLALLTLPAALFAATGEVSLSGSTWTGKVDGSTVYTGSSMSAAGNACVAAMSSGTLRIYNSGPTNGSEIRLKSNVKVDAWGNTLTGSGSVGIIRALNYSTVGGVNTVLAGSPWYGFYFSTCTGQTFTGISGGAGIALRIDNCKGGPGTNLSLASPTLTNAGSHGVETYGINGVGWSIITASDRTGGCGLLLNMSSNVSGKTINATRCNNGGGYAGFRMANTNDSTTVNGTVTSNACGRGFFSLTASKNSSTAKLNASNCTGIGAWIQDSPNTKVLSGTLQSNAGGCYSISGSSSGSSISVSCQ